MPDYDNNMTGAISKNDYKKKESHPDYRGKCEIDGRKISISGWVRERKDGSGAFLALAFQFDEEQPKEGGYESKSLGGDTPF